MTLLKNPVTSEDHTQGSDKAIVTLVEYGDYQCPFCAKAYPIVKALQKHFGKQLRFVFRNFPLSEVHPLAEPAAETAESAATFKKFWEMHDHIYENQPHLSLPLLLELGINLELPAEEIENAIKDRLYRDKIKKDFLGGVRSGVNGTPTFYINGQRFNGEPEFESLLAAIEQALAHSQSIS